MSTEINHCVDCCCARSWQALGVTEYDGKSIPEHITRLKANVDALEAALKTQSNCHYGDDTYCWCKIPPLKSWAVHSTKCKQARAALAAISKERESCDDGWRAAKAERKGEA